MRVEPVQLCDLMPDDLFYNFNIVERSVEEWGRYNMYLPNSQFKVVVLEKSEVMQGINHACVTVESYDGHVFEWHHLDKIYRKAYIDD